MNESRYSIGIDLGTTNSAVSFVDLDDTEETGAVTIMQIPQLTAPGAVEERVLFPSFLYVPHPDELSSRDIALPWVKDPGFIAGELARKRGTSTPIRLVSSAKSWLCYPGVDRRAPILPQHAPEEVRKISPLQASTSYLEHMRDAWNSAHPNALMQDQDVVLTVPASFDPAARELTAEAAKAAGFKSLVLLEEPQAAFYNWIQTNGDRWRQQVRVGDVILVVDVGGGTTDLSLIAVNERDGAVDLVRIAVGDHILLGGDNMDLALAHVVKGKLAREGKEVDSWQLQALAHACREAKEVLLSDSKSGAVPIVVPSRGSKLVGRSVRTELTRAEVAEALVEGFFPAVEASARPDTKQRGALTRIGLPYAQDPAITKHLAAFLGRQVNAVSLEGQEGHEGFVRPTAVLFNGGVFKAGLLTTRIFETLNQWLHDGGAQPARMLEGADLDLAVSRGAAYYGQVRRGRGVRIRGGTARAYYVGIESSMPAVPGIEPPIQALCVAPFGMEEGTGAEFPPQEFGLIVGEPVRLRFFGSSVRRQDTVGTLLETWPPGELEELQEIGTTLPAEGRSAGEVVPVRLHARVTELGTLKLEAAPRTGNERWEVEFEVRK